MAMPKSRWIHSVYTNADGILFATVSPWDDRPAVSVVPLGSLTRQELRRAAANLGLPMSREATVSQLLERITAAVGLSAPVEPTQPVAPVVPVVSNPSGSSLDLGVISEVIRHEVSSAVSAVGSSVDEGRVADMIAEAIRSVHVPQTFNIVRPSGTTVTVQGAHRDFAKVLNRVQSGLHVWLHGEAGVGKSTLGEQLAEALGVEFYPITVTAEMTVTSLAGYNDANGRNVRTDIQDAVEFGGLALIDEASSARPNTAAWFNMLLANGWGKFANGKVKAHENFYVVAAANDVGQGPSAKYPKGLKQDASFLDRFTMYEMDLDMAVVEAGVAARCGDSNVAARWMSVWSQCRRNVKTYGLGLTITPRAAFDGATLLSIGESTESAVRDCILKGMHDVAQTAKVLEGTGITI